MVFSKLSQRPGSSALVKPVTSKLPRELWCLGRFCSDFDSGAELQVSNLLPNICAMVMTYLKILNDRGCEEAHFKQVLKQLQTFTEHNVSRCCSEQSFQLIHFFFYLIVFRRQNLPKYLRLAFNSLCNPGWPSIQDSPVSRLPGVLSVHCHAWLVLNMLISAVPNPHGNLMR